MSKLIELESSRSDFHAHANIVQEDYSHAAPFFYNPRGILAHRVRSLFMLENQFGRWWIIEYWCGNSGRSYDIQEDLLFDPGERLVCKRCEDMATQKGKPSSSTLAGRHVCTGVCRPVNVCCPNESN